MSQPRVAFITNICPYYRRPLFERLAESLRVTFYFYSEGEERYLGAGVRHDPVGLPTRDVRRLRGFGHPLSIGLARELNRRNYDVIVKCINGRLMTPYVYALAKRRRIPFVLWTGLWHHPETTAHRLSRPAVERVYRGADAIVTYGEHVKRYVSAVAGVDSAKAYVAGQAIEAAPFAAAARPRRVPPNVLFVGRLEEEKGLLDLLDAFAGIGDRDARLRVAGAGPLAASLRAWAARDPRIEPLGQVDRADLPRELAAARCLALPSVTSKTFREPWGLVVNEAMASGTPVVATDAVGAVAGGLVEGGRNGLVVGEREPAALAAAIESLLADEQHARALGERARADVAAFSYARMERAFVAAVEHALQATTGRAPG